MHRSPPTTPSGPGARAAPAPAHATRPPRALDHRLLAVAALLFAGVCSSAALLVLASSALPGATRSVATVEIARTVAPPSAPPR